jgi:hypothetical protein
MRTMRTSERLPLECCSAILRNVTNDPEDLNLQGWPWTALSRLHSRKSVLFRVRHGVTGSGTCCWVRVHIRSEGHEEWVPSVLMCAVACMSRIETHSSLTCFVQGHFQCCHPSSKILCQVSYRKSAWSSLDTCYIPYQSYLRSTILRTPNSIQGGSNMTGTNCDLFTHKSCRSYLYHLVCSDIFLTSSVQCHHSDTAMAQSV